MANIEANAVSMACLPTVSRRFNGGIRILFYYEFKTGFYKDILSRISHQQKHNEVGGYCGLVKNHRRITGIQNIGEYRS